MMITLQQILKALNLDPSASEESMNKKLFMAKRLDVSFHSISKLNHMSLMNRLTELRLEHNAFRRVPESINILTELEILNLAHNKIVDGFEYLPKNLKCLDMSFNRIKRITIKLPCPNLTLLDVSANPICNFSTSSETFRTKLIDSLPKLGKIKSCLSEANNFDISSVVPTGEVDSRIIIFPFSKTGAIDLTADFMYEISGL